MKLTRLLHEESNKGAQLRSLAAHHLNSGIRALDNAKEHFENYADLTNKRRNEATDIEDFSDVSAVSQEDTFEAIKTLDELLLMLRMSHPEEDKIYDEDELERQVIYKQK